MRYVVLFLFKKLTTVLDEDEMRMKLIPDLLKSLFVDFVKTKGMLTYRSEECVKESPMTYQSKKMYSFFLTSSDFCIFVGRKEFFKVRNTT